MSRGGDRQELSATLPLTRAGPLSWRAGAGWLVLVGSGSWRDDPTGEVDAAALGWADLDRPTAVLPTAGQSMAEAEALLETYADLGGPHGYVVPIVDASGAHRLENCRLLREAGLVYISDGPDGLALMRALQDSPALSALTQAFQDGAVIVGAGVGAAVLGAWMEDPQAAPEGQPRAVPAWGWLPHVIVEPHFEGAAVSHGLRRLLDLHPDCLGLGIPDKVALGLGPTGEVESVGPGQVTVVVSGVELEG